jgi:ethanolamine utilization cobalamin adenosyltransferase
MKKLITELDIINFLKTGFKVLFVDENTILTPLAKDKIKESNIELSFGKKVESLPQISAKLNFCG